MWDSDKKLNYQGCDKKLWFEQGQNLAAPIIDITYLYRFNNSSSQVGSVIFFLIIFNFELKTLLKLIMSQSNQFQKY